MDERLRSVRAKLARAQVHVDALKAEALAYFNAEPKFVSGSVTVHSDGEAHYAFKMKPLGDDFGPVFGDVLHNVRSALDHLMGQLVYASKEKPTDNTYFPTGHTSPTPDRFGRVKLKVHDLVSKEIHDALLSVQAFTVTPKTPKTHFLAVLPRLSNKDKHNALVPTLHRAAGTFAGDVRADLFPVTFEVGEIEVHEDGSADARLVPVGKPDDYMDSKFTLQVVICLSDEPGEPPLVPMAQAMVRSANDLVTALGGLLGHDSTTSTEEG